MIAVIKTGGKQYKVQEGDVLKIENIPSAESSKELELDDILNGKKVVAQIVAQGKNPKVRIVKFHKRKRYTRNIGHRQKYSQIKIISIK